MPLRTRDLACRDAVELVTAYLDGALGRRDRRRLERHLRACPNCAAYLAQIRATVAAVGSVEPDDLDQETLDTLVDLYHRWRADGEAPS